MRYAIATASISAASGTTPASGTAVLAERINGVVTPISSDYRTEVSVSQAGQAPGTGSSGGKPGSTRNTGSSDGGDDIGKRDAVWTVTPVGSIFGNNRPQSASSLTTIPASQIFPYYNFEDDGTDWSGRGLDLTVTNGSYSTTRVVGSKSANFQNSCHFSRAHNEYFASDGGAGIRVSFWIYPVALGSGSGASDIQGIITKASVDSSSGSAVFDGDWGIFYSQNLVGSNDLHVATGTTSVATQILHGMELSTGAWYFIDVVFDNYNSVASVNVRGAATTNSGNISIAGNMEGDTSFPLRIGNNSDGNLLGANSARFYLDAVSFSNDFTSPTTDEMYNSGSAYATGYTAQGVESYLPSAATSLVTGTYQVPGDKDVPVSITGTSGAVRPAMKITKPTSTSADVSIEAGTATSKFVADFTADPSVGTVRQTSNPKAAEVVWKGKYANHPIEIHESDNGMIIDSETARASECSIGVTSIGAGSPYTSRSNSPTGPQDMGGTVASGAVARDKSYGESSDPEAAAKALGYSPGAAITVRNPTGTSYSSGNVLRIEKEGNGWVIL